MLGPALTCAWLEVASASGVGYGVAVRLDSRVRSMDAAAATATTPSIAGDADLNPSLFLQFDDGSAALRAEYAPRLSLREATTNPRTELQHVARLVGDWRPARGLAMHGTQELVLGRVDLFTSTPVSTSDPSSPDTPTAPPGNVPLQPLPDVGSVYFLSSLTTVGAETAWLGRGLRLSGSVGFGVSGGLDGPARVAVPLQYGPRAQASLGWALVPRHTVSTTMGFTDSRFSTGAHASVLTLTGGWTHRLDRLTSVEAGAGVGVATSVRAEATVEPEDPVVPAALGGPTALQTEPDALPLVRTDVIPDATLALTRRVPSRVADFNGRLSARVTPFVDRLTGGVYPRADLTLSGTWTLGPRVRVSATGGTAFAVGGATADTLVLGGAGASWTLSRLVSLETEARTAWTRSPGVESARFQWSASLGLAVRQAGIL